jgi:hypothetical protein
MLRTSRLTWVFGEAGTDSPALLKSGVMPLLQRRSGDRLADASGSAEADCRRAAPDRRRQPANQQARPRREAAIYFDTWGDAPLSLLKRNIDDIVLAGTGANTGPTRGSLTDTLQRLNQRLGLHVVFVLDRFEEYLALPPHADEVAQFANEWVEAVANQELPASFLVSMDEAARPRLERLRARLPGFDDNVLRLSPVADKPELPPDSKPALVRQGTLPGDDRPAGIASPLSQSEPAGPPRRRGPPARVPISVDDVYALVESTLARTAKERQPAPQSNKVDIDVSAPVPGAGAAIVTRVADGRNPVSGKFKPRG